MRIGGSSKTFSPTGQNGFSRINTFSTFRFTYSRAGTELFISVRDLSFNIYIFSSRHKIWKNIKKEGSLQQYLI